MSDIPTELNENGKRAAAAMSGRASDSTLAVVSPLVLSYMLEDANEKLEILRSNIRSVELQLVGPPMEQEVADLLGLVVSDDGLSVYCQEVVENIHEKVDHDDDYDPFVMDDGDPLRYTSHQLKGSKIRIKGFFETALVPPDGVLFGMKVEWYDGVSDPEVSFLHHVDVGLGTTKNDRIYAEIYLRRGKVRTVNANSLQLPRVRREFFQSDMFFDLQEIADVAGISLEMLRSRANAPFRVCRLFELSAIPISTLEEKLGSNLFFEVRRLLFPPRVVRHKCLLL